jgi:hypothetical protein
MGWACGAVHEELREIKCLRTWKYGEYDRLLECLQIRYTDAIADGDDEQRTEATIDAAESRRGSYYDWGFHRDYCV